MFQADPSSMVVVKGTEKETLPFDSERAAPRKTDMTICGIFESDSLLPIMECFDGINLPHHVRHQLYAQKVPCHFTATRPASLVGRFMVFLIFLEHDRSGNGSIPVQGG